MNTLEPEIIPIGWNRPAIELVAERLRDIGNENPQAFRRATIVVPTSESGRRLKEYMAQAAGRPVLMPRITEPGLLIEPECPGMPVATGLETSAAWLHAMLRVAADVAADEHGAWFDLFPKPPMGSVAAWAANMARQLSHLRSQMEQECITERYAQLIQGYYPDFVDRRNDAWKSFLQKMGARWALVRRLFEQVDTRLAQDGLATREAAVAHAVAHPRARRGGGLVILACVPELSPLNELYLRNGMAAGLFRVKVLVNAPSAELAHFDAFGRPLVKNADGTRHARWLTDAISLRAGGNGAPATRGGLRCIHMVPDADAMGRKAVELAGGMSPAQVVVAACDNGMAPAVHAAFLRAEVSPWRLNLPSGRALSSTQEGQLTAQLVAALQTPHKRPLYNDKTGKVDNNEPNLLAPVAALMRNTVLQRCFAVSRAAEAGMPDLGAFNACLDAIMRTRYPAHMELLLYHLRNAAQEIPACYLDYAAEICRLVQDCEESAASMGAALGRLAALLDGALRADGGSLLAEPLRTVAAFMVEKGERYSRDVLFALLKQELDTAARQTAPLLPRDDAHGDLLGWKELTFSSGSRLIVCGMHDDCVPERPRADIFLPDALRCAIGISSSESRTARDSFLLTALLHSRPGNVDFIVARTRTDGAPPAPSSLLLRCGGDKEELAERAAFLFREDDTVTEKKDYRHWNLLHADTPEGDAPGNIRDFILPDGTRAVNPFAEKREFSPSFLKDFLTCPLRFWLKRVFRLDPGEAYPDDLSELQSADYGNVMHAVLEGFVAQYPDAASLPPGSDEETAAALVQDVRRRVEDAFRVYGGNSRAIMQVQKEQMQAALSAYASQHAADLKLGWRNVWREIPVSHPLQLDDGTVVQLNLRLDRVDFNDETQKWRIIDYKSHNIPPRQTHWSTLCIDEDLPRFAELLPDWCFEITYTSKTNNTEHSSHHRWTELQLPLYAEVLQTLCAAQGVPYSWPEMGYYNIPRGQSLATYSPLTTPQHRYDRSPRLPFSEEYQASAMACAKSAIGMIRRGECLYSAEFLELKTPRSSFGALTPDDDPRTLCGMKPEFNR